MIDKFSKRTDQIEAEAEKLGITDAARKAELGAKIRSKKQKELTLPELRKAWDAQLTDAERGHWRRSTGRKSRRARQVTPAEAVAFAIAHCSEQLSVVPERELKRVALLHGLGSVTPDQIAAELPRHGVITAEIDGRLMATTEELQAEERFHHRLRGGRARHGRARSACPPGWTARLPTASGSMTASGTR